jgi:hypothetical protein
MAAPLRVQGTPAQPGPLHSSEVLPAGRLTAVDDQLLTEELGGTVADTAPVLSPHESRPYAGKDLLTRGVLTGDPNLLHILPALPSTSGSRTTSVPQALDRLDSCRCFDAMTGEDSPEWNLIDWSSVVSNARSSLITGLWARGLAE